MVPQEITTIWIKGIPVHKFDEYCFVWTRRGIATGLHHKSNVENAAPQAPPERDKQWMDGWMAIQKYLYINTYTQARFLLSLFGLLCLLCQVHFGCVSLVSLCSVWFLDSRNGSLRRRRRRQRKTHVKKREDCWCAPGTQFDRRSAEALDLSPTPTTVFNAPRPARVPRKAGAPLSLPPRPSGLARATPRTSVGMVLFSPLREHQPWSIGQIAHQPVFVT
eukprot:gene23952-biopygen1302